MPHHPRVKRLLLVVGALVLLAVVLSFVAVIIVVGSAVAFSGSSSEAMQAFLNRLTPVAVFVAGAFAGGGIMALASAVASERGVWVKSIASASVGVGVAAVLNSLLAKELLWLATPAVSVVAKLILQR